MTTYKLGHFPWFFSVFRFLITKTVGNACQIGNVLFFWKIKLATSQSRWFDLQHTSTWKAVILLPKEFFLLPVCGKPFCVSWITQIPDSYTGIIQETILPRALSLWSYKCKYFICLIRATVGKRDHKEDTLTQYMCIFQLVSAAELFVRVQNYFAITHGAKV